MTMNHRSKLRSIIINRGEKLHKTKRNQTMDRTTCQPDLNKIVNNWLGIIQDFCYPPTCIFCDNTGFDGQDICFSCFKDLPVNRYCCYRCGRSYDFGSELPRICGTCQKQPPTFDETIAPFLYQGTIRYLIYTLKYQNQLKQVRLLAYLLIRQLRAVGHLPDCIIAVPLHKTRYIERGFNQSAEIAKIISSSLNIPLDLNACIRTRNTEHQTRLDNKRRRNNLRNAFAVTKTMSNRHIAILDDVITTGTTANEMAKVLKKAGADKVDVWVCARPV